MMTAGGSLGSSSFSGASSKIGLPASGAGESARSDDARYLSVLLV